MGSLELLSYFWSLNTIWVVKIENFDFGGLSHPPTISLLFNLFWSSFYITLHCERFLFSNTLLDAQPLYYIVLHWTAYDMRTT